MKVWSPSHRVLILPAQNGSAALREGRGRLGQAERHRMHADDDITGITDNLASANSQSLGYDALNRLTTGNGSYGSLSYGYDADGNRNTETLNGTATTFTVAANSNQLASLSGGLNITYSYDADGNLTGDGINTYSYDDTGRLASVTTSSGTDTYEYNALGQTYYI